MTLIGKPDVGLRIPPEPWVQMLPLLRYFGDIFFYFLGFPSLFFPRFLMNRSSLRSELRGLRQSLAAPVLQQASEGLSAYIAKQAWFLSAQCVGFYIAVGGEINLQPVLEKSLDLEKTCYLPVCIESEQALTFVPYRLGDPLMPNRYHILEPSLTLKTAFPPQSLDVVFAPLLAFDCQGNRLGSGKGYYDRTFAFLRAGHRPAKPRLIGLAYEFQEVQQLAKRPWDVSLDEVVVFDTKLGKAFSAFKSGRD